MTRHRLPMRGIPRLALALLCVPACGWSAIAGLPEPPTPRDLPDAWFSLNDDMFGDAILDTDDFRTGNVSAGWTWDRVVLAGDYSAFTHRLDPGYDNGTRIDELTLTLGVRLDEWLPAMLRERTVVIAGIGTRIDGNLAGEVTQNAIHRAFGFPPANLVYDQRRLSATALGYVTGTIDSDAWHPLQSTAFLMAQLVGASAASVHGEFQQHLGLNLSLIGAQGSVWIGGDYQSDRGRQASQTAAAVAEHETGPWITVGIAKRDSLYLSGGVNLRTRGVAGGVGYAIDSSPPAVEIRHQGDAPLLEVTQQDLEYFRGSGALGVQVRGVWWTAATRDVLDGVWSCEWLVDYHFGTDQDYQWQGNRIDFDQVLLGLEPECTLRPVTCIPVQMQPFVVVGIGARFERVKVVSPGPHRFDQTTAGSAVVQPGAGIRFRWCARADEATPHWYNLVWFGYGYDFWHPLGQAQVTSATDHADILRPGMGGHYSVGFSVAW